MAVYRINVVASYPPTEPMTPAEGYPLLDGDARKPSDAVRDSLLAYWGERIPQTDSRELRVIDLELMEDAKPLPARLTMTLACEIDAPNEWDARTDATSLFREECEAARLPEPESVLANAD
jgi:hypothetical protein